MKKITGNRTKRYWYLVPVLFILLAGCEKSHSDIEPEPEPWPDAPIEQVEIMVERPGNANGIRFVNLIEGQAHSNSDVSITQQHNIDFVVFNASGSGINFITPDNSAALGGFGAGRDINSFWQVKNAGTFIKLPSVDQSHHDLFDNLTSTLQLREAFTQLYNTIPDMPGYISAEHGPGRINNVAEGDIILYKSVVRNIQAIIKVTDLQPGNTGSVAFSAKLDRMNEKIVEAPVFEISEPVEFNVEFLGATGGRYFDLTTQTHYSEAEAEENASLIDLVILEGNNSNTNFITIDNDAGLGSFNTNLRNRLQDWETSRNAGEFIIFTNNSDAQELFDHLSNKYNDLKRVYDQLALTTSPVKRATNVGNGDVIFFYSIDRDRYVVLRIVDHIKHAASRGEFTALIKVSTID